MIRFVESPLRSPRVAAIVSGAIGALVYANALDNGFAYDDVHIILNNESMRTIPGVMHALTEPYWPGESGRELGLWRPGTTMLLGLQYAGWGTNPVLYHLLNVLLHAATAGVLVLVLSNVIPLVGALAGGLLFAVHPLHSEAVANVVGVAELGAGLAYLLVCWFHVRGGVRTSWQAAATAALGYAVAFSFKESAVTLPAALFLLDASRSDLRVRDLRAYMMGRWRLYLLLGVVGGGALAMRKMVLGSVASPLPPLGAGLLDQVPRIWTLAEVWSHYVRLLVFPLDLSADYAPAVIPIRLGWGLSNGVGAGLALVVLALALVAWRRGPLSPSSSTPRAVGLGVVWFVVTVLPVSNVVFISGVLLAERALYVPSIGVSIAFGWFVVWLLRPGLGPGRRVAAVVSVALVVALMGARTWVRTPTWKNNDTVFSALIGDYPHSGRSQWLLGDLFFRDGAPERGVGAYREAVRVLGAEYSLLTDLGVWFIKFERYEAAVRILSTAHTFYPSFSRAPGLLAFAYLGLREPDEAARYAEIAVSLSPEHMVWHDALVVALEASGRRGEAIEARMDAISRGGRARWRQWLSLAELQAAAGNRGEAFQALDSADARARTRGERRQVDSLRAVLLGTRGGGGG